MPSKQSYTLLRSQDLTERTFEDAEPDRTHSTWHAMKPARTEVLILAHAPVAEFDTGDLEEWLLDQAKKKAITAWWEGGFLYGEVMDADPVDASVFAILEGTS